MQRIGDNYRNKKRGSYFWETDDPYPGPSILTLDKYRACTRNIRLIQDFISYLNGVIKKTSMFDY